MMRLAVVGIASFLLFCGGAARAEWIKLPADDNPFVKSLGGAATGNAAGQMFGFRCDGGQPSLMFLTAEQVTPRLADDMSSLNLLKPVLRVAVDDDPIVNLPATLLSVPIMLQPQLRGDSAGDSVAKVLRRVVEAKRRIAVALVLNDQILHTGTFETTGSRRALAPLLAACQPS
jgi:hypothetical protein